MKKGRYESKVGVKPRSGKKTALIIVSVLAVLILGVVGAVGFYVNSLLDGINHVEVAKPDYKQPAALSSVQETEAAEATQPAGEGAEETAAATEPKQVYDREDFSNFLVVCKPVSEDGSVKKTQTMILVTLNNRTRVVTMTALMEGACVDTPEYKSYAGGQATLDSVYGMGAVYGNGTAGSMEFINQTLFDNFGVEVDHNFEFDLELFAKVVARIGGVTIELSEEEAAYLNVQPGAQSMDGTLALEYVRMWNDEEIDALSSQSKLVDAILKKIRGEYVGDLANIVYELLPSITTSMTSPELKEFLMSMLPLIRNMSIENGGTCPMEFEAVMADIDGDGTEEEVLTFDAQKTIKAMRELTLGEVK